MRKILESCAAHNLVKMVLSCFISDMLLNLHENSNLTLWSWGDGLVVDGGDLRIHSGDCSLTTQMIEIWLVASKDKFKFSWGRDPKLPAEPRIEGRIAHWIV